jgi:hypothetical protein
MGKDCNVERKFRKGMPNSDYPGRIITLQIATDIVIGLANIRCRYRDRSVWQDA